MGLRKRVSVVMLLTLAFQACGQAWREIPLGTTPLPERVRVTTDSARMEVREARVVGDSVLVGATPGLFPVRVPLRDVQLLEAEHVSVPLCLLSALLGGTCED